MRSRREIAAQRRFLLENLTINAMSNEGDALESTRNEPSAAGTKIQLDGNADAVLAPDAMSVWIEVRNIAVYIRQADDRVAVDLYAVGAEDREALASTWALYAEADDENEAA